MAAVSNLREADTVPLTLTGGRVTAGFRKALFSASERAGMTINEFVLKAAGEKLASAGASFPGVFVGDEEGSAKLDPSEGVE